MALLAVQHGHNKDLKHAEKLKHLWLQTDEASELREPDLVAARNGVDYQLKVCDHIEGPWLYHTRCDMCEEGRTVRWKCEYARGMGWETLVQCLDGEALGEQVYDGVGGYRYDEYEYRQEVEVYERWL